MSCSGRFIDQANEKRPRGTGGYYEGQRRDDSRYRYGNDGSARYNRAMTRNQAQAIVRSAYLNVLGREPDPASAGWVDRVLTDHWSQAQLERELRNSAEYRQKHPRESTGVCDLPLGWPLPPGGFFVAPIGSNIDLRRGVSRTEKPRRASP